MICLEVPLDSEALKQHSSKGSHLHKHVGMIFKTSGYNDLIKFQVDVSHLLEVHHK